MQLHTKFNCKVCKGVVVEKISVRCSGHKKHLMREGFHCKICGIRYEPTEKNCLVPTELENSEIENIILNSKEHSLKRPLLTDDFLETDGKKPGRNIVDLAYKSYPKIYTTDERAENTYYFVKTKENFKVLEVASKGTTQEKVPKKAIEAILVFVLDENLKTHYFLIPKNMIVK